jgi:hypothetical protein
MYFLFYYGHLFHSATHGIDIVNRTTVRKGKSCVGKLLLVHPIDHHSNVADTCHKYESRVRPRFAAAFSELYNALLQKDVRESECLVDALLSNGRNQQDQCHRKTSGTTQNQWGPYGVYTGGLGA